ncbi:peroxin-19, partial [Tremellales sp. Uapishka_1]
MSENQPSSSYRQPKIEDDDGDDLDDLDDVLASFNAKPSASTSSQRSLPSSTAPPASNAAPPAASSLAPADDEDFEASLIEGMESLLRSLAGDHPPGPMPDVSSPVSTAGSSKPPQGQLSAEEEEKAWQKALETMLSGEGLQALGLEDEAKPKSTTAKPPAPTFEETMRKTMESLQKGGEGSKNGQGTSDIPDLSALLAQFGGEAKEGDDDLGGILDGMMSQLMTREVLQEPMSELAAKYPAYLASPPAGTSSADLEKYKSQQTLVRSILDVFAKKDYSDDKDSAEIATLVEEMQDLGGPPKEIMGELPEGFDLAGLGGDEGCTIM